MACGEGGAGGLCPQPCLAGPRLHDAAVLGALREKRRQRREEGKGNRFIGRALQRKVEERMS